MSIEICNPRAPSEWTDARIFGLKAMWADGSSARQIADQLGGISRSAVIGKIHRLGLASSAPRAKKRHARGPRLSREEMARRQKERALARHFVATPALAAQRLEPVIPGFLNLTFEQLAYGDNRCRFPVGAGPVLYCGQPTITGTSWCQHCFDFTHKRAT